MIDWVWDSKSKCRANSMDRLLAESRPIVNEFLMSLALIQMTFFALLSCIADVSRRIARQFTCKYQICVAIYPVD